jgi:CRISPR/Cas system-associated exonuclease Cas4 (RecB family)
VSTLICPRKTKIALFMGWREYMKFTSPFYKAPANIEQVGAGGRIQFLRKD